MDDPEVWRGLISVLLIVIGVLVGLVYKALRDEVRSLKRQFAAFVTAILKLEARLHPEQGTLVTVTMADLIADGFISDVLKPPSG
jgi:hypothetical protein